MSTTLSAGTATSGAALSSDTSGILQLQSGSTPTTAVTIDTSQNVGVGVTPSAWGVKAIQMTGGISAFVGDTRQYYGCNVYINSSIAPKYITSNYAVNYAQDATGGTHAWQVASSGSAGGTITWNTAMTLNNSGQLLVGVTSTTGNEFLNITSTSQSNKCSVFANTSNVSGSQNTLITLGANCNNTSSYFLIANQPGTRDCLYIYGNGNVVNQNNSYGTLSDAKIKTNIVLADTQWNDVKALGQVMKKFNLLSDPTGSLQLGWVAQDVKAISSGLVFSQPDLNPETNEPLGTETLGVNTSVAMLKAFKALSEALVRIETLEAKVTALEAKVGI